jgi:hypothetical protein
MVKAIANKVLEFFLSLKTSVVLMLGLLFFFVAGALVMPVHPAFETINSVPLFEWLRDAPTGATWWLLGSIALLAALVANTLACSIESLIKKRSGRQWLLVISPQVIHIGFLLMLLGHLVSASGGFKANMFALEGTRASLPNVLWTGVRISSTRGMARWSSQTIPPRTGRRFSRGTAFTSSR